MDRSRSSISSCHRRVPVEPLIQNDAQLARDAESEPVLLRGPVADGVGSAALLRKVPGQLWAFLQRRLSITVEVPDRDPAFRWLQVWLAVAAVRGPGARPEPGDDLGARRRRVRHGRRLRPGRQRRRRAPLAGEVPALPGAGHAPDALPEPALDPASGAGATCRTATPARFRRTCRCRSWGAARALVEQLLAEARKLACPRTPGVSILTARYESWETTSWQPRRPLESLVLADGVLEDLLDDLRTFYGSRSWYVERGRPLSPGLPAARAARETARRRWCWPRRAS